MIDAVRRSSAGTTSGSRAFALGCRFVFLIVCATLAVGCGGKALTPITATATVPIEEGITSGSLILAKRSLPWADRALTERASLAPKRNEDGSMPEADRELSPGVLAARERLALRTSLEARIAKRLDELPAGDPPPGSAKPPTFAEFAAQEPEVAAARERALRAQVRERVLAEPTGGRQLEATIVLQPVADAVLAAGGGNRQSSRDGEPRANAEALKQAREKLVQSLLKERFADGLAITDWLKKAPMHRMEFEKLVAAAEVVRSSPQTAKTGREWTVTLRIRQEAMEEMRARIEQARTPQKRSGGGTPTMPSAPPLREAPAR